MMAGSSPAREVSCVGPLVADTVLCLVFGYLLLGVYTQQILGLDNRGCFGNLQDLPAGKRTLKAGFAHKAKTDQEGRVLVRDGVPIGCKSRLVVKV